MIKAILFFGGCVVVGVLGFLLGCVISFSTVGFGQWLAQ
jgi:hypothetical protein